MINAQYIVCSHVDWTQEPFGKVFFYQVFDATGLQVGSFVGQRESAEQFIAGLELQRLSPAALAAIWRKHWPDAAARQEAEEALHV
jgi:hypothetical protein